MTNTNKQRTTKVNLSVTEEGRRPTEVTDKLASAQVEMPDPEAMINNKKRRNITAKFKLRILDELDNTTVPGEKGAILRREGLYSSQITDWRRQRELGALTALGKSRGRKKQLTPEQEKLRQLEKENARLKAKLNQAEVIIDIQKKVSQIFGITLPTDEKNESK